MGVLLKMKTALFMFLAFFVKNDKNHENLWPEILRSWHVFYVIFRNPIIFPLWHFLARKTWKNAKFYEKSVKNRPPRDKKDK
jgi:hypothetical protein